MNNLENILKEKIVSNNSVGGGSIADSRKIRTESGREYFIKSYYGTDSSILRNEANGLSELRKANAIRIPEVIYYDDEILIIEYIASASKGRDFSELFGRQFAQMHKLKADKYGFFEDNYIGSNPQKNSPQKDNWIEFYWENRLLYQYRLAERNGYANSDFRSSFVKFEQRIAEIISGTEEEPCILHGDLWGGNYIVDEKGDPVLIDPAVYYGHREADLGMTKLFGGFDSRFYAAYNEAYPLPEGWEYRLDLYKLYHVMNHLNLFGTSYFGQVLSIIKSYIGK